MDSIDTFNKLNKSEFLSIFGNVFEKTEWIAEKCYDSKPYNNAQELVNKMMEIFENSVKEKHLEILNAHPDLAVKKKLTKEFMEAFKSNQISKSHDAMHKMMNETIGQSETFRDIWREINKRELQKFHIQPK